MDAMLTGGNSAVTRFVVSGLPLALGTVGPTATGHAAGVVATTGAFVTMVICDASAQDGLIERAVALARDQVARL